MLNDDAMRGTLLLTVCESLGRRVTNPAHNPLFMSCAAPFLRVHDDALDYVWMSDGYSSVVTIARR